MWSFIRRALGERRPGSLRLRATGWLAAALFLTLATRPLHAVPPSVEFDLAQTAMCRPVPAPDCVKLRSGDRVVEVVFELSTRVVAGHEADIKQINVEIRSPDRQLSLVGFSPSTTLLSESVDGVIEVEERRGVGQLAVEYGVPPAKIQASLANAGEAKIVEKKLAPKSLLVASGTMDRSHGVFFTLHPSNQDSLQKSRPFVCQFAVPQAFRADYIQFSCSAVGTNRGVMRSLDADVTAGLARFTVGIYLEGDREAKGAADLLADRQQELFNRLMTHSGDLAKSKEASRWWNSVGKSVWSGSSAKPSPRATTSLASHQANLDVETSLLDGHLPDDVANAVRRVQVAKRSIRLLNGQ